MEHKDAPFSKLHKAKFDTGLAADLPDSPEGLGDAYMATDTHTLYICENSSPFTWSDYVLSDIGIGGGGGDTPFIGVRSYNTDNQNITDDLNTNLEFTTDNYDTDFIHDESISPTEFLVAENNVYDLSLAIKFDHFSSGTNWEIRIKRNDVTLTGEDYNYDTRPGFTAGSATGWFIIHTIPYLTAGDVITIEVYQNAGGAGFENIIFCRLDMAVHK